MKKQTSGWFWRPSIFGLFSWIFPALHTRNLHLLLLLLLSSAVTSKGSKGLLSLLLFTPCALLIFSTLSSLRQDWLSLFSLFKALRLLCFFILIILTITDTTVQKSLAIQVYICLYLSLYWQCYASLNLRTHLVQSAKAMLSWYQEGKWFG